MRKNYFALFLAGLAALSLTWCSAQEKIAEPPKAAHHQFEELLWGWTDVGRKIIAMAEDFPETKYAFKAQKDQRTFAENLIHIAYNEYEMINAIKGKPLGPVGGEDSVKKLYSTKADIVKYMKQVKADGEQLITEQGDNGLTREFKYPWGNLLVHGSFGWWSILEHTGEHYGQLVVYYRVNEMIPPESRPKK
jgi:hypothetical protein